MTDTISRPTFTIAVALVQEAARLRGIKEPAFLMKRDRTRTLAYARFGIIWVMRNIETPISYHRIRNQLGFKDHKSVMYGEYMATVFRESDPEYRQFTDDLLRFALSIEPKVTAEAA